MRRLTAGILIIVMLSLFAGCSDEKVKRTHELGEEISKMNNCTLLVNGKDITHKTYVRMDKETGVTEVPLLAMLSELGAKYYWQNEHVVVITYEEEKYIMDITEDEFGIYLGGPLDGVVRKMVGNEIVMDSPSVAAVVYPLTGMCVDPNYETGVISVYKYLSPESISITETG